MPTITIPDDTFERLTRRATELGTTIEALVAPVLDRVMHEPTPPGDLPYDEWKKLFDDILAKAQSRADRYPPGFQADVSRESMYEGCGE